MKHELPNRNTQRGAVLAVGLILLVVATLVTLTAMNTGVMQERMTANQDNNARSFMAAEAGGAALVAWLDANPWPTTNAAPRPPLSDTVGGDPSITYVLNMNHPSTSWTPEDGMIRVVIEGRAFAADNTTLLARTELLIEFTGDPPGGWPPPVDPPAAISCFNGPCNIQAGAGRGADVNYGTVSGFNHPLPPLTCSGGNCRMRPIGEDMTMPVVPAVFMEETNGSSVGLQGGNHNAYQGLDQNGNLVVGRNMSVVVTNPEITWQTVFPDPPFDDHNPTTQVQLGIDGPTTDSITVLNGSALARGIAVVDGGNLTMQGNPLFIGLIVIRNCGTLGMGGNGNVYGAVIVDAQGCGPNYDPFAGNGTPAVRFSRAPLSGPPGEGIGTGTGERGVKFWSEYLE